MEEELKNILSNFDCGPLSEDDAVKAIFSLFGVSKLDLCKTCQNYWLGHEESKKDKRYCISCKDAC